MDPITFYLFISLASGLATLFAGAAWLSERLADPGSQAQSGETPSPVWSFNNMPAGAKVDTVRSVRESGARGLA